ncbi:MAG: T9SS type A sorting domain-containing protein, partial [Bacteroidetes bacterium]|nr:T9SS type A sorting domain-containing protein [Bacteroidota bacterium]
FYDRVIDQGTWNLTFSKPGYYSKTINNVTVTHFNGVHLDVQLKSIYYGTGDLNQGELTIYPVPASKDVRIVFPETDSKRWRLDVLSPLGVSMYSSEIVNSGKLVHNLDVALYPDGIYFVRLSNENGIYRKQIIVRHR